MKMKKNNCFMFKFIMIFIFSTGITCTAKDIKDEKRGYRNPKLSLHDNVIRSRNMLKEVAITQGTATGFNRDLLYDMKRSNFYKKKTNSALPFLDLKISENNMKILKNELNLIEIKKD